MNNPLNEIKVNEIRRKSEIIRGRILDITITIEFFLTEAIVNYFSKENIKDDFCKYILKDSFGFNDKKEIFKDLKNSKKLTSYDFYENFMSDLSYVQSLRNKVAHSDLYLKPEYVNNYNGKQTKYIITSGKHFSKIITINHIKTKENYNERLYSFPVFIATAERLFTTFK